HAIMVLLSARPSAALIEVWKQQAASVRRSRPMTSQTPGSELPALKRGTLARARCDQQCGREW
ncbi:MAG: hypothetical protein ACYCST_20085, partial [Acidimicrobiales bacterium]